jgi:hypothetical protein
MLKTFFMQSGNSASRQGNVFSDFLPLYAIQTDRKSIFFLFILITTCLQSYLPSSKRTISAYMALLCSLLFLIPTIASLGSFHLAQVSAIRPVVDRHSALGETENANKAMAALLRLTETGTIRYHMVNLYLASYFVALAQLGLLCWANLSETLATTESALNEAVGTPRPKQS